MTCIVVGMDGSSSGEKALAHAKRLSRLIGDCELVLAFIIEWTPYSFHTPEELAERHKRREQEIDQACASCADARRPRRPRRGLSRQDRGAARRPGRS
jgi:nucleotide-binding universal stress UspA family protein